MTNIMELIAAVNGARLKEHVHALEGVRHCRENYDLLEEKGQFIEEALRGCEFRVESQPVIFQRRRYRNIIATLDGTDSGREWLLLGAHYDSPWQSPGADDNASGVAALLEVARVLSRQKFSRTIQFVAFTLEEPQTHTHIILRGSKQFVREAKRTGVAYAAAIILECVGYTDKREQSQILPRLLNMPVPTTGDFLAVIANHRSLKLMNLVHRSAATWVPKLKIVPYAVPLAGYLIPQSRFSDHAPFWDNGYQALMLTDTAMFRNPYYHTPNDTGETIDFEFLAAVTRGVVAAMAALEELR